MSLRILMFCWEAGSAGALVPVALCALERGHKLLNASLEPANSILRQKLPSVHLHESDRICREDADVVLAGLGHPRHEQGQKIWRRLRSLFPTFVLLDHWKGIERFAHLAAPRDSSLMPHALGVIDEPTRNLLVRMGMEATSISVVGVMATGGIEKMIARKNAVQIRKRLNLPVSKRVYFLASETIHSHDFDHACSNACHGLELHPTRSGRPLLQQLLLDVVLDDALLVVRPHPNQQVPKRDKIRTISWLQASDDDILAVADRIYGLSSMILTKAVTAGVETVNVSAMLNAWSPTQVFLHPEQWVGLYARGYFGNTGGVLPSSAFQEANPAMVVESLEQLGIDGVLR